MHTTEFTTREQIEMREALRVRLRHQIEVCADTEDRLGAPFPAARDGVVAARNALLKVLPFADDGEGLGIDDDDLPEFLAVVATFREVA